MKTKTNKVVQDQPCIEVDQDSIQWGDQYNSGSKDIKIGCNNVGRLWIDKKNNIYINEMFILWLMETKFDIFGVSEMGINWTKASANRNLKTIGRKLQYGKSLIITMHNKHENISTSQWGGVVIKGKITKYCSDIRKDPKKLGR